MLCLLKRLLKEEQGYGTVELLLIIAGVGSLAIAISVKLLPALRNLHATASQAIIQPSQSGF